MTPALWIDLVILSPLAASLLIIVTSRHPNLREAVTLFSASTLVLAALAVYFHWQQGEELSRLWYEILPGIRLAFAVEPLGLLFTLLASGLWLLTSIYSIGYMRANKEMHQTRFYACFAVAIASTMGIALAENLFTLFLFYEILTLSTYPLVTHKGTPEARRGGRIYLGLLLGTSIGFFFVAIVWTWLLTGSVRFQPGGVFNQSADDGIIAILFLLYLYGVGKAALMPLHRWLPAAMVAPTPVSALLHAVAVVKAGVFTVVKIIVYIFGSTVLQRVALTELAIYLAGATIILASVIALQQDNLKLRLAYSTVSQLSYVILAAVLLSPLGIVAAAVHIVAHAFGKITLFFTAGAIYTASHKTQVSELNGIGRTMPLTLAAFTIGALTMIGLPLTAGFVSKWYFLQGAMAAKDEFIVAIIFLSTLLNAGYYLPIVYAAFFKRSKGAREKVAIKEAPWPILMAQSTTAVCALLIFFYPEPVLMLAQQLAKAMIP